MSSEGYSVAVTLKSKFVENEVVFVVLETNNQFGESHQCSHCQQLHYTERFSPAVYAMKVEGVSWSGSPPDYQMTTRYDLRNERTSYSALEKNVFATEAEAHEQRKKIQAERAAAYEKETGR